MNSINKLKSEQKIANELEGLFTFVPPQALRRSLEDLFFHCFSQSDDPQLPDQKTLVANFSHLINFLNEVEHCKNLD